MKFNPEWRSILWVALPITLIALAYLLVVGEWNGVTFLVANAAYLALLTWVTHRATSPLPPEQVEPPQRSVVTWAQIGAPVAVILLTGLSFVNIPLWSSMVELFYRLGETFLPVEWFGGPGNSVANPVQYFVIPFILLLVLKARPGHLGFGQGNRVWIACLAWLALPVTIWIAFLATGFLPPQTLARRILANAFQNGFFEEFLFRGALLTRLRRVMSAPWALALQAVVFGLWHLQANTRSMEGNLLAGLALCIVSQTVSGLVYGIVFQRTRNLITPSVAHVAMNVLGQSFG
jgi:membrane protease YdiL (CAAX protease family)